MVMVLMTILWYFSYYRLRIFLLIIRFMGTPTCLSAILTREDNCDFLFPMGRETLPKKGFTL